MQIDRASGSGPAITGFSPNGYKVEAGTFRGVYRALTITPDSVEEWDAPAFDALSPESLADLLAGDPRPEFLLLGTGATMRRPAPAFVRALEARGIGVEAMDSRAAARAWAVLRGEGRWVVGALYPL
ncbi:Mth938-like domain-containing protein [Sphingomonas sp. TREG-RG-20F-R18-01]|uniref:Mth938-like domain-containing protein n=1 Tax=Sphingomonas sp. TREG-RG-20F-R18-01 TaxID=2914982 RepID=UPI001F572E74|nr:Mth938-like domain-containing protein [Sphingomonas sp. TREG-RG-20F-R18-01]